MTKHATLPAISLFALACALGGTASAQDTGSAEQGPTAEQLGEITVTARRRTESLQSVPLTVQAFTAETIASKGIRSMEDVVKFTPGIFFDKGFVQQDVRPNIRGLPATRGRPPVGILLDGIDISSESIASAGGGNLANMKLVDLERIEVVKGPQSALYGRVAFGGAINYISKEPTSDGIEGYISGEAATYNRYETRGAINLPATDTLSFRINGAYSRFDGFYDNAVTGKRIGGYESKGGAIAAKFETPGGVKLVARASYSDDTYEVRPQYYIGGAPEVNLRETIPLAAGIAGQQVGIIGAPQTTIGSTAYVAKRGEIGKGIGQVQLSADPATGKDFPGTRVKTFLSSLRGEFDVTGNIMLSTWTGYTRSRSRQRQDGDFFGRPLTPYTQAGTTLLAEVPLNNAPVGFFIFDAASVTEQFSHEVRVADQTSKGFRWAVGALYWWESVNQKLGSISNSGFSAPGSTPPRAVNIYANLALLGGYAPGQAQARTTNHYSAYALAELDITDKLTASFEGRYANEEYDYLFARNNAIGTTAVNGVYPLITTGAVFRSGTSTNYFAPRAGLTYTVSPDLLFYGSFARGVKPAGLSQVQTPNPADAAFGTEKLNNYEIGFKSSLFDRRVRINAAIFRMEYKDKQESTLVPVPFSVNPQGNVSIIQNVGGARIDGAELEISGLIAPGLTFNAGYTYLNARYTDYDLPSTSPISIALAGGCTIRTEGNLRGCFVNLDGRRLEASARHSAVGSLSYRTPITQSLELLVEGDMQYRGRRYQDNTNSYWYSPYANVDLRIGVENGAYSLIAYVTNVFDNRSIQSAQSGGDTQGLPAGGLSMAAFAPDKRQFGLRGRFNF